MPITAPSAMNGQKMFVQNEIVNFAETDQLIQKEHNENV
jgi:hypothetical protein